jgi:hypothetical protein
MFTIAVGFSVIGLVALVVLFLMLSSEQGRQAEAERRAQKYNYPK